MSDVEAWVRAARAAASPAEFSRRHFGWTPYPYQARVMDALLVQGVKRVAWVAGRRMGKTATIANVALQLAVRRPGTKIAIFAPTERQAGILLDQVKEYLFGSSFEQHVLVNNKTQLRLRFGVDGRGKPRDSDITAYSMDAQVRGGGADVLIVDESAQCDSGDFRTKALPFIANKEAPILVHISTILAEDDHFSEALRKFKPPEGLVFRTSFDMHPNGTPEKLADLQATMTHAEFQREYMCNLVADGSVFAPKTVQACLRDYQLLTLEDVETFQPKRHHQYYVGVDWGKMQDRAVIAVVEQGTQEKVNPAKLVFLQVYPPDPHNDRHYTRILAHIQQIARKVNATRVTADQGEGGHQAEVLKRELGGVFKPFRFTEDTRNKLVERMVYLVEHKGVILPFEPEEVRRAFANVQSSQEGGYSHYSRATKDIFDAIALALKGAAPGGEAEPRRKMTLLRSSPRSAPIGLSGYGEAGTVTAPPPPDPRRALVPEEYWDLLD